MLCNFCNLCLRNREMVSTVPYEVGIMYLASIPQLSPHLLPSHMHTHMHAHTCTHTHMHAHTLPHTHARTHTSTHTCTHTYSHTPTHTHTRDKSDNIELLRYRVQSLQECCGRQEKRLEQMEAENQRLMREGGENASLGDGGR